MELYNKYRYSDIASIVGNSGTKDLFKEWVEGEMPHCLLFFGPSGNGKTSAAKMIGTLNGIPEENTIIMNCKEAGKIDDARELINNISRKHINGKPYLVILDEAHQMNSNFQDALQNITEEPPEWVYFIMCTTAPEKIIKTLRSRGLPVKFETPTNEELQEYVRYIAEQEGTTIRRKDAERWVEKADGNIRTLLNIIQYMTIVDDVAEREKYLDGAVDEENPNAFAIFNSMFNNEPWSVMKEKVGLVKDGFEGGRHYIMKCAGNFMMKNLPPSQYEKLCDIIEAFRYPFYDNGLEKEKFIYACYMNSKM